MGDAIFWWKSMSLSVTPPVSSHFFGQYGVSCRIMDFAMIRGIEEVWSDLFKWLHSDRECSGTGVGRAFCRRLVACFGGRIRVEGDVA